jgi:hypothetical protein
MFGHLWSMETNSDSQRVCRRFCDEAAGSPKNISTRGSMAKYIMLRCCFGRLFASLSTWLACKRRAQRPRLTTPRLPPRPSRRNSGIGPEVATSLAWPLRVASLTKLQWLELRYGPLAVCGGVVRVGREAGRRGDADGLGAREGGNTLRFATSIPTHCHAQTASFPTTPGFPAPARYHRRSTLGPGSASALAASLAQLGSLSYLNRVGPGDVARSAGRPVVPESRRRRASQGEQVLY